MLRKIVTIIAIFTFVWLISLFYFQQTFVVAQTSPQVKMTEPQTPSARPVTKVKSVLNHNDESDNIIRIGILVYAGDKTGKCFSNHFLAQTARESTINVSLHLHAIKLNEAKLYKFPMVIMTGEGSFTLTQPERESFRQYIDQGGFILASSGCSSKEWDRSFRREMAVIFPDQLMEPIPMDHPVFHMVYDIEELRTKRARVRPLEGLEINNNLGLVYSPDGLNDTQYLQDCCCCEGNELVEASVINVNVLAYALLY